MVAPSFNPSNDPSQFPHLLPSSRHLPPPSSLFPDTPSSVQNVLGGCTRPVRTIAYSPNGKKVATGCDMKVLRVWDVREKMDPAASISLPSGGEKASPHAGHVGSVAWSPKEGEEWLLASGDRNVGSAVLAIWDIRSPKAPIFTHKLPGDILQLNFHPNGQHIAAVVPRGPVDEVFFFSKSSHGADGKWALREDVGIGGTGVDLGMEEINSLRFSHSGKMVIGVSNDGSITAWSYPLMPRTLGQGSQSNSNAPVGGEDESSSRAPTAPGTPMTKPSDDIDMNNGSNPVSVEGRIMSKTELAQARQLPRIKHSTVSSATLLAMGLCPTGRYLAVGGQDALLSLFTTRDWICVKTYDCAVGAIRHITFSPDGEYIALGGDDPFICLISIHTGEVIRQIKISGNLQTLAWHPTNNWLAYAVTSKAQIVWHVIHSL